MIAEIVARALVGFFVPKKIGGDDIVAQKTVIQYELCNI